jgi:hypothetical protein
VFPFNQLCGRINRLRHSFALSELPANFANAIAWQRAARSVKFFGGIFTAVSELTVSPEINRRIIPLNH